MPLRSRAFCLSLRSRRLDFIPGGIYQGALNSFIHSFSSPSPPPPHTHTQLHVSHVNVVCCIFGRLFFHTEPFWDCLQFSILPVSTFLCWVLLRISGSLGWPSPCSHISPLWGQVSSLPSLSLTWSGIFRATLVVSFSLMQVLMPEWLSELRERVVPYLLKELVFLSFAHVGIPLYTHSRSLVNMWLCD